MPSGGRWGGSSPRQRKCSWIYELSSLLIRLESVERLVEESLFDGENDCCGEDNVGFFPDTWLCVHGGVVLWETVDHFSFSWRQRHDGQDKIGCLLKKGEYEESDEAWASSAAPESINRGSSDIESTARAAEVRGRQ